MKKIFLFLLLLAVTLWGAGAVPDTQQTWSSTSNTVFLTQGNWTSVPAAQATFPSVNTYLRFIDSAGITEAVPAAPTADITCDSLVANGNAYALTFVGRKVTVGVRFMMNCGSTITLGNALTITGNGQIHFNPTGAQGSSACSVYVNGTTDTFDMDKAVTAGNVFAQFNIGTSATCLNTSGTANYIRGPAVNRPVVIMNTGSVLTNNSTMVIEASFDDTTPGLYSLPTSSYTINGTGAITLGTNVNSKTIFLPAIKYTGSGAVSIGSSGGSSGTYKLTGTHDYGGNTVTFRSSGATATGTLYALLANFISGKLNMGTTAAGQAFKYNLNAGGSDTITTDTVSISSTGQDSVYYPSVWYIGGSWLDAAPGAGDYRSASGQQIFNNTKKALIQTKNHTLHFYDVVFRATATDSLDDSATAHSWTIDSCPLMRFAGKNMYLTGDLIARGRTGDTLMANKTPDTLTFVNAGTFQVLTQQTAIESLTVRPKANLYFNIDKTVKVRNVRIDNPGTKITISAGQTLTLAKNAQRGWCGTAAAYDTVVSSSAGNKSRIALSTTKEDTCLYLRDIAAQNFVYYDTLKGKDGSGDSNVVFLDSLGNTKTPHYYYVAPTTVPITAAHPAGGTSGTTISETLYTSGGQYFPESVSVDAGAYVPVSAIDSTKGYFSYTIGAAGMHDFYIKNTSCVISTGGIAIFTATPACTAPTAPAISYVDTMYRDTTITRTMTGNVDSIKYTSAPAGVSMNKTTGAVTFAGRSALSKTTEAWTLYDHTCSNVSGADTVTILSKPDITTLRHPMGRIGYRDTCDGLYFRAAWGSATLVGTLSTPVTINSQTNTRIVWTVPTKAAGTYYWIYVDSLGARDTVLFRVLVPVITPTNPP